jgi:hypothetical protein
MNEVAGFILAIISAALAGGGIGSLVTALIASRKAPSEIKLTQAETEKREAETAEIITRAAQTAAQILESQLENLRTENAGLRCDIQALRAENVALSKVQKQQSQELFDLRIAVEKFDIVLAGAHLLYEQVIEMNGVPKYEPPERRKHP